ncbi:receptor-like protein 15 isoform X2 [Carya illinoinensis]|uniref:receptor-like protein 15 isoform X2 n=1 Tax=Carya illinoinensis TaxID=32201 RepID=UPI001C721290|nr:receptor-like protein 15 isoform X2 [Carya illinoinensis]
MEFGIFGWWLMLAALFQLSSIHGCLREERVALLQFKASLNSSYDYLTSWNSSHEESNCCDWKYVMCNNTTRHVIKLDLHHVRDFSNNDHEVWYLNASLFLPFQELKYLDLGWNEVSGWVPNEGFERLSRLSKLEVLNLDGNYINESFLSSLGQILTLKKLYLRYNKLLVDRPINIPISELRRLKNLQELYLDGSNIDRSFLRKVGAMTSLNVLTIRGCRLNGSLPIVQGLCELMNLRELDLSHNNFEGILPSCLANMTELQIFNISSNLFNGSIDLSPLPSLKSLEYLDLSHNYFNPITFSSFFNLSKLEVIFSDGNNLVDQTLSQRWNLGFQLKAFSCSSCFSTKSSRIITRFLHYQFDLQLLHLPDNKFSGQFPTWLLENNTRLAILNLRNNLLTGTLQLPNHYIPNLLVLDISFNNIQGPIPTNFGLVFPNLEFLNISKNDFEGVIPSSYGNLVSLQYLDMSSNNFSGTISEDLTMGCSSLYYLRLSKNHLSGQLFPANSNLTALQSLYLDNNHFFGEISHSISNSTILEVIDFSNNNLLGMLPGWMGNMMSLTGIVLKKNQLEGLIPVELCNLKLLLFLDLSQNNLAGSIPSCFNWSEIRHVHLNKNGLTGPITNAFKGCSNLVTLNLRDNYLIGNIPDWIRNLSSLSILLLKSNYLQGKIPIQICFLEKLSLLDLSNNSFSGQIPHCLSNITFESSYKKSVTSSFYANYLDSLEMSFLQFAMIKNKVRMFVFDDQYHMLPMVEVLQEVEFSTKNRIFSFKGDMLNYMSGIDLSCNKLEGEIPPELGDLSRIHTLNLSFNNLTGSIPTQFSKLNQIESLDLSNNNLDGIIPPQLIELNFLAVFNVAHNNFWGTTPERKAQFGTFDESSYEGNPLLCGPPLHKACTKIEPPSNIPTYDKGDEACGFMDFELFYIGFAVSYMTMLLGIVAILYINPHWRLAWFNLVEACISTCYYFVVIKLSSFRIV